jgi:outer membrane biosynthesis protein TonB
MISTSDQRRSRRTFEIAVAVSLLIHLLGLFLWGFFGHAWITAVKPQIEDEPIMLSDALRIERNPVAREAHRQLARPQPKPVPPQPRQVPQPPAVAAPPPPRAAVAPATLPPVNVPHELAHAAPKAEPNGHDAPAPPAQRAAPPAPPAPPAQVQPNPNALSQAQIDALNARFSQTIAQARIDPNQAPAPKKPAAANKRYQFVMSGRIADLRNWHGEYWEHAPAWFDRSTNSIVHYLHIHIAYPDGTSEDVDLPWPVIYPRGADPVAVHAVLHEVPPPPAGFELPHPFNPSRVVCIYYKSECQALFDAENAAGGAPAGN